MNQLHIFVNVLDLSYQSVHLMAGVTQPSQLVPGFMMDMGNPSWLSWQTSTIVQTQAETLLVHPPLA